MQPLHTCHTHKAFCSIIHDAQLKTLLILKGLCKSTTEGIRRQNFLTAALKLVKNSLESVVGEEKKVSNKQNASDLKFIFAIIKKHRNIYNGYDPIHTHLEASLTNSMELTSEQTSTGLHCQRAQLPIVILLCPLMYCNT